MLYTSLILRFLSFAGLPRKWGMKALCFRRCKGQYWDKRTPWRGREHWYQLLNREMLSHWDKRTPWRGRELLFIFTHIFFLSSNWDKRTPWRGREQTDTSTNDTCKHIEIREPRGGDENAPHVPHTAIDLTIEIREPRGGDENISIFVFLCPSIWLR